MENEGATPEAPPVMQVEQDQFCVGCSYNLRGLPVSGRCPECGAFVERSLRGDLLEYSAPAYLGALSRGIQIIVVCTIAQLVMTVVVAISAIAFVASMDALTSGTRVLGHLISWSYVALSLVVMYGWYHFSTPDPAIVGSDKGDTPRRVVRIAAMITAALSVTVAVIEMLPTAAADPAVPVAQELTADAAELLGGVAWLVLFFTSLVYIRWIARRIPDPKLEADATRYMWLVPLIYILLVCIIVGPIIAVIMYLTLLYRTREAINHVRATQAPLYPPVEKGDGSLRSG